MTIAKSVLEYFYQDFSLLLGSRAVLVECHRMGTFYTNEDKYISNETTEQYRLCICRPSTAQRHTKDAGCTAVVVCCCCCLNVKARQPHFIIDCFVCVYTQKHHWQTRHAIVLEPVTQHFTETDKALRILHKCASNIAIKREILLAFPFFTGANHMPYDSREKKIIFTVCDAIKIRKIINSNPIKQGN